MDRVRLATEVDVFTFKQILRCLARWQLDMNNAVITQTHQENPVGSDEDRILNHATEGVLAALPSFRDPPLFRTDGDAHRLARCQDRVGPARISMSRERTAILDSNDAGRTSRSDPLAVDEIHLADEIGHEGAAWALIEFNRRT